MPFLISDSPMFCFSLVIIQLHSNQTHIECSAFPGVCHFIEIYLIICPVNPKFNDSTISLNHRVQFTYAQPVVLNTFDM